MSDLEQEAPATEEMPVVEVLDNVSQIEKEFQDAKEEATAKPVEPAPVSEPSELEKRAMEQGWKPQEQFDSSKGRRFIGAEEFLERGELFGKIEAQKNEVQHLKKVLKDLGQHIKTTEESSYQRALMALDRERQEAIKQGNTVAFQNLEQQMIEAHKYKQSLEQLVPAFDEPPQPVQQALPSKDAQEFFDRNKAWFNPENPEGVLMCKECEVIEEQLRFRNPKIQEKDLLLSIEKEIQRRYPEKFENPKRAEPQAVASKSVSGSAKASLSGSLTPRQRQFGEELVHYGVYDSLEAYAKDCQKNGEIKK